MQVSRERESHVRRPGNSDPPDPGSCGRRGFLAGLTTLPLVGGGVTLIGRPSAVAGLPSPRMLGAYLEWLRLEHDALGESLGLADAYGSVPLLPGAGAAQLWHRDALRRGPTALPATRAALVLAGVGLDPDARAPLTGERA